MFSYTHRSVSSPLHHQRGILRQLTGIGAETHNQTLGRERSPLSPSPEYQLNLASDTQWELRESQGLGEEELWEPEVSRTSESMSTESTKQNSWLTATEVTISEPKWVCAKASAFMLWSLAWYFCGAPESGSGGVDSFCLFLGPFSSF